MTYQVTMKSARMAPPTRGFTWGMNKIRKNAK